MQTFEIHSVKQIRIAESIAMAMKDKTKKRICLGCGETVPKAKKVTRGLCPVCAASFYRHAARDPKLEAELMKRGKLLPCQPTGRKPSNSFTEELAGR